MCRRISPFQGSMRFFRQRSRGDALASLRAFPWLSYSAPSALPFGCLRRTYFTSESCYMPLIPDPELVEAGDEVALRARAVAHVAGADGVQENAGTRRPVDDVLFFYRLTTPHV